MDKKIEVCDLKKMSTNENNVTAKFFGVTDQEFFDSVTFLHREGYITKPMYADDKVYGMALSKITEKGENYLKDNSKLGKGYKFAKGIRDWFY